jgi:hypothetical protein
MHTDDADLPRWLSWGIPAVFILLTVATALLWPAFVGAWVVGELGILENLEVLVLVAALVFAVKTLASPELRGRRGQRIWIGLFLLGVVYILGEEISWGQHYVGWGTPEWYQTINDQQETNLHNTSSWLDQKPRALLEFAIYYSMLIHPWLRRRWQPGFLTRLPAWTWPTRACLPVALFNLAAQLLDSSPLGRASLEIGLRLSEVREFLLFYFLYCYIHSFYRRRAGLTA